MSSSFVATTVPTCMVMHSAGAVGGSDEAGSAGVAGAVTTGAGAAWAAGAAVHHGGAGTCARAARAGIPQVLLPHMLDQFPWAARLARRGLAPGPLFRAHLSSKALAARMRQALDDTAMRQRAAALAGVLAGRHGAGVAAELLAVR